MREITYGDLILRASTLQGFLGGGEHKILCAKGHRDIVDVSMHGE